MRDARKSSTRAERHAKSIASPTRTCGWRRALFSAPCRSNCGIAAISRENLVKHRFAGFEHALDVRSTHATACSATVSAANLVERCRPFIQLLLQLAEAKIKAHASVNLNGL
jgi:hypothetical protein